MSNTTNEQTLEQIFDEVLEQDSKGLLEDDIEDDIEEICYLYELHADDDRDEILSFIAEGIFYNQHTMEVAK